MQRKTEKKWVMWNPFTCFSTPWVHAVIFSRDFLSRHAWWTMQKWDYSKLISNHFRNCDSGVSCLQLVLPKFRQEQKIVCMEYFLPRLYYRQEPPVSRHCRSRKRIHRRCVQLCKVKNLVFKWGWDLDKGWYLWGDLKQNLWSKITRVVVNQRSPMNLWPWEWIHWFLWFTMIWVILDHWSWSGSHQRKAT